MLALLMVSLYPDMQYITTFCRDSVIVFCTAFVYLNTDQPRQVQNKPGEYLLHISN